MERENQFYSGVNPEIPVGLNSFDPNPSANLVSVGREGDCDALIYLLSVYPF